MTDTIRETRPKLSINGAARCGSSASVHDMTAHRALRDEAAARTQERPQTASARTVVGGIDLASVLDPVCSHFGADEAKAAELDAFARKLLGGTIRR